MAVTAANTLVSIRLDYCNSLFRGLWCFILHKLQSIQNTLTRIVTNHRRYAHVTPILKQLSWLPMKYRCVFITASLVLNFYIVVPLPIFNLTCLPVVVPIVPGVVTQIVNILLFLLSAHQSLSLSNILITALPLMPLGSEKNSVMMCAVQHQLPPSKRT